MSGLLKTTIAKKTDWTPDLITLTLDHIPEGLKAGQFFNLALKSGEEVIRRSYSAASAPGAPLSFFISRVKDGALTPRLFELAEGDRLLLDPGSLGFFTLAEVPDAKSLWLVATGTGLGPYLSMLRAGDVFDRFEKIILVHGVRHRDQLAYREEFEALCKSRKQLRYIPVLSGKDEVIQLGQVAGRITTSWKDGSLEKAARQDFDQDSHMLLCGNPAMITDMSTLLKDAGYEKHRRRKPGHFGFEKYW